MLESTELLPKSDIFVWEVVKFSRITREVYYTLYVQDLKKDKVRSIFTYRYIHIYNGGLIFFLMTACQYLKYVL